MGTTYQIILLSNKNTWKGYNLSDKYISQLEILK